MELLSSEIEVVTQPKPQYSLAEEGDIVVIIDITMTENLKNEGLARDIVRRIQKQRKEAHRRRRISLAAALYSSQRVLSGGLTGGLIRFRQCHNASIHALILARDGASD